MSSQEPKTTISEELRTFFDLEIQNEADGGDSPTTLGSTWDSMQQMDNQTLAEYVEQDDTIVLLHVRRELLLLVEQYGYDLTVENHF